MRQIFGGHLLLNCANLAMVRSRSDAGMGIVQISVHTGPVSARLCRSGAIAGELMSGLQN